MKKGLLTLGILFIIGVLSAQTAFNKGDKVVNIDLGLGAARSSSYKTTIPPVSASFEYGIIDGLINGKASIGVGGYLGYTAGKYDWATYTSTYSDTYLGARGAFHYSFLEKLDTYSGISLGYDIFTYKSDYSGDWDGGSSGIFWSWFLGARYYFTESLGVNAELGYGVSYLSAGVTFKF